MDMMYKAGIEIHYVSVIILMAVVAFNIAMVVLSKQIRRYAVRMRIVMPITATFLAIVLFTGMIMMASKHLAFTPANLTMIGMTLMMIMLEVRRYKILKKKTDISRADALETYRPKALRILGIELAMLVAMSVWMLLL